MAETTAKDTIYVDVDDEITSIIEKVRGSDEKIVALVLPKRATVLQSIVNMKLLKRSAGEFHKKIVLITSEANLLPLAGAVGLYVAKTLQSAPTIPDPPSTPTGMLDAEVSDSDEAEDVPVDKTEPIGKLAGMPDEEETIDIDDDADDETAKAGVAGAVGAAAKKVKNKKLKVPNFDSFRRKLFLVIGGLVALLFVWILLNKVLPKATITITTDSSTVDTKLDFTADTNAEKVDEAKHILPATQKTFTKTDKETVATSGQKDEGKQATGSVTMTATECSINPPTDVPAGTSVSQNGLGYVTNGSTSFSNTGVNNGGCFTYPATKSTDITAQKGGNNYNTKANTKFAVAGRSDVTATGSASGGTTKVVKVAAQSDINGAKQKILDRNTDGAKDQLNKQMKTDQLFAISDTFTDGTPAVSSSSKAGDEASEITVNLTISYTMLGVKNDDLKKLVEDQVKKQIDPTKQTILSNGLDAAKVSVSKKISDTKVNASLQTTAEAGPQLDPLAIKKEIAGKKRGDTQVIIENRPGIKDVKIVYSPFWVGATPTRLSRITVTFIQPNGTPSSQP